MLVASVIRWVGPPFSQAVVIYIGVYLLWLLYQRKRQML